MFKVWAISLIIGLVILYITNRPDVSPQNHIVGKLPALEERVPPRLREKAIERRKAQEAKRNKADRL